MTPEETIRNLINRSGPRKGTDSILSESWFDVNVETAKKLQIGRLMDVKQIQHDQRMREIAASQSNAPKNAEEARLQALSGFASRDQWEKYRHLLPKEEPKSAVPPPPSTPEAQAARNREEFSKIKYEPPTPTGPYTTTVKHEVAAPAKDSNQTGVQQPQPEQPESPTAPGKGEGASPSSIDIPSRQASGAGQVGSGLNVSNIQANVQRFLRQSFDPMETRKSFIRESVRACLKNK